MEEKRCRVHRRWKYLGLVALFILYTGLISYLSGLFAMMTPIFMAVLIILRKVFETPEQHPYKPLNWKVLLPWMVYIVGLFTGMIVLIGIGGDELFINVISVVLPVITVLSLCVGIYAIWEKYYKKPRQ